MRFLVSQKTMQRTIQQALTEAVKAAFNLDLSSAEVALEHPADPAHGDWAANTAMQLAKQVGKPPREIAQTLVATLQQQNLALVDRIEVAGPGFINFHLSPRAYVEAIANMAPNFGAHSVMAGKTVMVEFGQPNTHKAFHVGHLKSAISGLAMCNLLENYGYKVIRANFYGDVGMHVANCTWGALQHGLPAGIETMDVHERMKIIDGFYVYGATQFKENPEAEAQIRAINTEIYQNANTPAAEMYKQLRDWSLEHLNAAFAALGVNYDRQYPESEVFDEAVQIVKAHIGDLFAESQGAIVFAGEAKGLNTWVMLTKDGHPTYEAKDLALGYKKFHEYHLDLSIITTSVEQRDHFRAVIYCLEQLDAKFQGKYIHLPFGWLLRDNKKTSSRMGNSIKGVDVLQEAHQKAAELISGHKDYAAEERQQIAEQVGTGALKFLILSHEFHKDINYNPDEFVSLDGFSGPYIMYANARAQAILREAGEQAENVDSNVEILPLELELARLTSQFPEITLVAAAQYAPHLVAVYLHKVAQAFNRFYTEIPVLKAETTEQRTWRLALTKATSTVLTNGLKLLAIEPLDRM